MALLGARLAGRTAGARGHGARLGELDAPLPRDLRADVQPLPAHERALVPRLPGRGREGGRRRWALWARRDPGDGRDAPVRSPRARHAGGLCTRARAHAGGAHRDRHGRRARVALLVQRPRPRRPVRRRGRDGGQKLDGPGAVLEYLYRVAGDFTVGLHAGGDRRSSSSRSSAHVPCGSGIATRRS